MMKVIKKKQGEEVLRFFNQMIGLEDIDPLLISGRYETYLENMTKFVKVWKIFANAEICQKVLVDTMSSGIGEILKFVDESEKFLEKLKIKPTQNSLKTEFVEDKETEILSTGMIYDKKELNEVYRMIKKSELLSFMNKTYANIKICLEEDKKKTGAFLSCLDLPENMSNRFIINAELDGKFLAFSSFDFQHLYKHMDISQELNKLVLLSLRCSYVLGSEVFNLFISPDIDTEKFTEVFIQQLSDVKKVIPGCDEAFKRIKKSASLLRKKFPEYYKQFMLTGNSAVIFECFLGDVIEKNKKGNNKTVIMQFKKIVNYVKEKMNNLPKQERDPNIEFLWKQADLLFDKFDK